MADGSEAVFKARIAAQVARARAVADPIWCPLTEPIDFVTFAGHRTPGIAEISGAGSPRRWDERESYGFSGAFVVYHGQNLSHFSVRVRLITEQDWIDWYGFKPIIDRVPLGKIQRPVDIVHPLLGMLGIHAAVVEDVTQASQVEDGIWEVEIKCIEYRSPRLALAAAKGAQATPGDPEDARIDEQQKQNAALAEELERRPP
jgi:hypothetical protein